MQCLLNYGSEMFEDVLDQGVVWQIISVQTLTETLLLNFVATLDIFNGVFDEAVKKRNIETSFKSV